MSGPGQQQVNFGEEQLDPGLAAEFQELLESITKTSVKKVLARNKVKLVRKAVVNEEALQGLTEEKLVAYGLYEADAAALKVAFPTPTLPGAGGAAGGSGAMPYLTAYQAIMRQLPGIQARTSPRASSSCTRPTQPRTFSRLQPWPEFQQCMVSMKSRLDNTRALYVPVMRAGSEKPGGCYAAAADESEIRGALQNASELVNDVARNMTIDMELVGAGSGRGASQTDWLVRRHGAEQGNSSKRAKPDWMQLSKRVFACVEVKGPWQVNLGDEGSVVSDDQINHGLWSALRQVYGYMVLEEAPLGMVTVYNKAILLRRCNDVADKTLQVSCTVGLDDMLLALLTLLDLAKELSGLKAQLPRGSVPRTPVTSSGQRESQRQPHGKEDGSDDPPGQETGQVSHRTVDGKPKSAGAHVVSALESWDMHAGSSDSCQISSKSATTSAGGSSGSRSEGGAYNDSISSGTWPVHSSCGDAPRHVKVFGFSDLQLTDTAVGSGRYGNVLQGCVAGQPAAVKMFDPKFCGAADAFLRELDVYRHLETRGLQGTATPRLLCYGVFEFTGAFFLALSEEGPSLSSLSGPSLTDAQGQLIKRVVRQLHSADVLHGDVRRANFVVGPGFTESNPRGLKVLDFEQSYLRGSLLDVEWVSRVKEEEEAVERLCSEVIT